MLGFWNLRKSPGPKKLNPGFGRAKKEKIFPFCPGGFENLPKTLHDHLGYLGRGSGGSKPVGGSSGNFWKIGKIDFKLFGQFGWDYSKSWTD